MLHNCSEFQSQNVQVHGYAFHDTKRPNSCESLKIQCFFSNEIYTDIYLLGSCGNDSSRKFCGNLDGKIQNWECLFVHRKQGLFSSVYMDDVTMTGKKQNMAPRWKKSMKHVDLDEFTSFVDHVYLGCIQRECKPNEIEDITQTSPAQDPSWSTLSQLDCLQPSTVSSQSTSNFPVGLW